MRRVSALQKKTAWLLNHQEEPKNSTPRVEFLMKFDNGLKAFKFTAETQ